MGFTIESIDYCFYHESMELPIVYLKGSHSMMHFCHEDLFFSMQTMQNLMKCSTIANSDDPDQTAPI